MNTSIISIRLNEQEKEMINNIAKINGVGIDTMIKNNIWKDWRRIRL